jgi:hypothetical protein
MRAIDLQRSVFAAEMPARRLYAVTAVSGPPR